MGCVGWHFQVHPVLVWAEEVQGTHPAVPMPCLTKGTGRAGVVPSPGSFGPWMILGQAQEGQKPSIHRNGVTRDWLKLFWTQFGGFLLVIPQGSPEAGAIPTQVPRKDPG